VKLDSPSGRQLKPGATIVPDDDWVDEQVPEGDATVLFPRGSPKKTD
jgi:hypothetical protein